MPVKQPSITNIALVGGGQFCKEILEKTTSVYEQEGVYAPILAVADPNPESPGRKLADELVQQFRIDVDAALLAKQQDFVRFGATDGVL